MLSFFKHFGKSKLKQVSNETRKAIARADKEGFSEAVLGEMEENLSKLAIELAEKRKRTNKEIQEYDEVKLEYDKKVTAAKKLKADIDAGDSGKLELLTKLLDNIDEIKLKVEKEKQEADFWSNHLTIIESNFTKAARDLKTAKQKIAQSMAKMEQAEIKKAQAEELKNLSMRENGLSSSLSSLDAALGALDDAATKAETDADAAEIMSSSISKPDIDNELENYLEDADNKPSSIDDRMANL